MGTTHDPGRATSRALIAVTTTVMLAACGPALAAAAYEPFFGKFEGKAVSDGGEEISKRDLRVTIGPTDKGFFVEWVALVRKPDGRTKRAAYKVAFQPSSRANIYSSVMRNDMFGHAVPLDPLKGDPYVWARIEGNVLSVYSMLITDEGGYEMHVHDRMLVGDTMELEYSRVRDGEVLRTVTGMLRRIE